MSRLRTSERDWAVGARNEKHPNMCCAKTLPEVHCGRRDCAMAPRQPPVLSSSLASHCTAAMTTLPVALTSPGLERDLFQLPDSVA